MLTRPGADYGSDLEFVIVKMRLKLKAAQSSKKIRRIEDAHNEKFNKFFERNWKEWTNVDNNEATSDVLWNKFKHLIQKVVAECNPKSETHNHRP